ncbi:MAG TPA: alkaline phosphatase family protein [Blastocatellia bacterium]
MLSRSVKLKKWRHGLLPVYLIVCCSILPLQSWLDRAAYSHSSAPRRLVLILDGVPYQTMAELRAEGRFRRFKNPARMVSMFPSLTNVAMIEILQAQDSPGYEDHYYDRDQNRLFGAIQDRLNGGKFIQRSFRNTFDYHAPAFKGSLAYVAAPVGTIAVAHLDISAFRKAFREFCGKSDAQLFVAYIGETDSLAHLGGRKPLKALLRALDRTIEEFISESANSGARLEVEMFSDHGNNYADYTEVKLNDAINSAGFRTEKTMRDARSVVLPKFGLVGASTLFTHPENRARLAEVCAKTKGVDFAVYQSGEDVIELISVRGHARLSSDGDRFKYEAASGDPLGLVPIIAELKARGAIDADGFASREDWWHATMNHRYVDPLRRLFDGFNKYVRNRADVIVSYEDGYMVGSPFLGLFAEMVATHGNLLRGETEGFAISTRQDLGEAVRGHELNRLFALDKRRRAGTYFSGEGHCQLGPTMARMAAGDE